MRVLFVCVENSCRSQMAEGFARALDGGLEACSGGSRPSGTVDPRAIRFMAERGIDISDQQSTGTDEIEDMGFDCVVTMGCGDVCPQIAATHRLEWEIPDPKPLSDAEFRAVRDAIEERVRALLSRIRGV